MEATVVDYDDRSSCVHVVTATGRHLAVYPLTDYVEDCGSVTAYPMRPGYASTVHKLRWAELPHITRGLRRHEPGVLRRGLPAGRDCDAQALPASHVEPGRPPFHSSRRPRKDTARPRKPTDKPDENNGGRRRSKMSFSAQAAPSRAEARPTAGASFSSGSALNRLTLARRQRSRRATSRRVCVAGVSPAGRPAKRWPP